MLLFFCRKRAQSVLEYATLIIMVSIALIAMYAHIRRAVNSRLKNVQLELDEWRR